MQARYVSNSFVKAAHTYPRQKANYCCDSKIAAKRNKPGVHTIVRIASGQHKQHGYYEACGDSRENSGSCDAFGKEPEYHTGKELCDASKA